MIQRFVVGSRMSQAVRHRDTIHIAGQVADDRKSSLEVQTKQVLDKIEALIVQAGGRKSDILSVNVFLSNITDFDAMNSVYDAWIDAGNPPARACVEARLADPDLRVEMTAVAVIA